MNHTVRLTVATALVGAILIPYAGYSIDGEWPWVQDARSLVAAGIVLGTLAWLVLGPDAFGPRWLGAAGAAVTAALGLVAAALGTGTGATLALGGFVATIVSLWLVALARRDPHADGPAPNRAQPHRPTPRGG